MTLSYRLDQDLEYEDIHLHPNHGMWTRGLQHLLARRPSGTPNRHVSLMQLFSSSCQVAVGTKSGELLIYDIASASLLETVQAHTGTLWSMHVRADGQALVTGSADKDVKFWEFEQKAADSDNVGVEFTCFSTLI